VERPAATPDDQPATALLYERLLPSLPWCVSRVRTELDAALARLDVPEPLRADIALVVTEAATNVVLHAYRAGSPGPLYATARLCGGTLHVVVCDCGRGHGARRDSAGAGFGTPLMTTLSDHLSITTHPAEGTCVQATFRAAAGDAPAAGSGGTSRAEQRGETLREYLRALSSASAALCEDTQALIAQAKLLIARGERPIDARRR
jgi:anti-sigma regulatory factor (Ser/Thr protein kinase)